MKKEIIIGCVTSKEQLRNSKEGGPRVRACVKSGDREIIITTATNSSAGYMLTCSMEFLKNRKLELEIHHTKSGSVILDKIISGYFNRIIY